MLATYPNDLNLSTNGLSWLVVVQLERAKNLQLEKDSSLSLGMTIHYLSVISNEVRDLEPPKSIPVMAERIDVVTALR